MSGAIRVWCCKVIACSPYPMPRPSGPMEYDYIISSGDGHHEICPEAMLYRSPHDAEMYIMSYAMMHLMPVLDNITLDLPSDKLKNFYVDLFKRLKEYQRWNPYKLAEEPDMSYKQIQVQYGAGKQHKMVQKAGNNSKQIQIFSVKGGPDEPLEINIQTTPAKQSLWQRIKCWFKKGNQQ